MTTFVQLQTEVQATGPFDTTAASSGRIKLWLNQAQHWFLSKRRWSFLETAVTVASVSGQADYVLAGTAPVVTDFGQMIDVQHNQANGGTTFVKLMFLPQQEFDNMLAVAGATPGIPIFYTIRGGAPQTTSATILAGGNQRLSVWPVMNYIGSLKIAYFRSVGATQLTADTDISIIPEEWQPALIFRAAGMGLISKGAVLQGQSLLSSAEEIAAQAVAADSVARRGDFAPEDQPVLPPTIPPNPSAGANPANSPYGSRAA
jgi:hypothetical protein